MSFSRRHGFTLVELLIALVITGIVLALLVPGLIARDAADSAPIPCKQPFGQGIGTP